MSQIMLLSMLVFTSGLTTPTQALAQIDDAGGKSPGLAVGLSVLGTAVPIGLMGAPGLAMGLVLGPNLGDFYLGESRYALKRTATRGAILVGTGAVALAICSGGTCGIFNDDDDTLVVAGIVVLGGLIANGVLGVREISSLDDRARQRNARTAPQIRVTPMVAARRGVGISLRISF